MQNKLVRSETKEHTLYYITRCILTVHTGRFVGIGVVGGPTGGLSFFMEFDIEYNRSVSDKE